ncbi:electron transfer flavoprotein subunit alpha/FixB family protein [Cupriavidus taiwanensis]|uniref:Electron transfer flavoprotein, alpha subunit n=1 Tax=Cupriavidus taiwanensis TaxID=164546 RepID=A0A7Z7NPR0_9BURK|nr:electron transfer flavoprotein subunit alpha/FixB family protein [Cupriavidus taiwanensis]SOZ16341.1 Electron transfer flavoprotein, alpha subunit [Cupriavidus taiwanensis]SOZ95155.1 Electron transfer flavoprotein, alpha subunit [Cupriavidus taiwanensis]SPC25152.1 Electron transfer flavoprotein, alpha subunit [Cupriavidus taiwanensis]SPD37404.1 Protein FixB [Cupriavidus taiwanensis]
MNSPVSSHNMPNTTVRRGSNRHLELPEHLKTYKGVWVFLEHDQGQVHSVSWELLGEAYKLADKLGSEVAIVALGGPEEPLEQFATEAFGFGANKAYVIHDPVLLGYRNEPFTKGLTDLVSKYRPEILLLGATTMGRDLAGSVATTLSTGLTADCTSLSIDSTSRALAATRPTFGGSLLCTIMTLACRPQMATVRPRVMAMPPVQTGRCGEIIHEQLGMIESDIVTKLLNFIADSKSNKINLPYADVIVSGGKGLKNPENFKLVFNLARVLGGEVGATRPCVQARWVEAERQVGQTGKTVRPKLYIAAGISGAIQHRVGMESSDVIVAINTDENAPIFDYAHYGIVGDAMQLLPALTQACEDHLAQHKSRHMRVVK